MGRPKEVTDEQILVAARKVFLEQGAGVSAAKIASELGVSHTTIFHRFGSKESLMLAALGPSSNIPWRSQLEVAPDGRPIVDQLVEHCQSMSTYFQHLQEGLSMLRAAGVEIDYRQFDEDGKSRPVLGVELLSNWLTQAREQGRLAPVDIEALAWTILGALQNWAFTAKVCGIAPTEEASDQYVERFVALLWQGIQPKHK